MQDVEVAEIVGPMGRGAWRRVELSNASCPSAAVAFHLFACKSEPLIVAKKSGPLRNPAVTGHASKSILSMCIQALGVNHLAETRSPLIERYVYFSSITFKHALKSFQWCIITSAPTSSCSVCTASSTSSCPSS